MCSCIKKLFFALILFSTVNGFSQNKISANVISKQFLNKKLLTIERDIYYQTNGKLVTHYIKPQEYFLITNSFGEAKVYNPKTNEVMIMNEKNMSSRNELIYTFLSNQYSDFGLTEMGFILKGQKKEGIRIIKTFVPKNKKNDNVTKIEIVFENTFPIYIAYYNKKNFITRKVYYSKYQNFKLFTFPTQITEISFVSTKDSIVKRDDYSNVKVENFNTNSLFDYNVPLNAKLVNPYKLPFK